LIFNDIVSTEKAELAKFSFRVNAHLPGSSRITRCPKINLFLYHEEHEEIEGQGVISSRLMSTRQQVIVWAGMKKEKL